jgi:predicted nucleic acid-binding protein
VNGFLVDTNCISEVVRPKPEPRVVDWMEAADESTLYLSVLTIGEIRKGFAGLPRGKHRTRLERWIEVELPGRFWGRVLPIDEAIAQRWGAIAENAKRKGRPLAVIDGLLAATALQHNLTIVSRNIRDFASAQVPILNPWMR